MIGNIRHACLRMEKLCQFSTSSVTGFRYTPKDNPGVYRRLKVISEDEPDIQRAGIDYDSIEDLDQDFMQAGHMHDEIMDEMKSISKARQFKITENRHFRSPKEPSMLSWSEKEQIRHLHLSDPDKWTAEILAESFPASPTIIKKILKWKWKPANAERLQAHDRKVSENWKAFHKGQLEVHDMKLRAHLAKFTDRKDGVRIASDEEAAKITEVIMPRPKRTEFLSIVKSVNHEEISNKSEIKQIENNAHSKMELYKDQVNQSSNLKYTLDQYCSKLEQNFNKLKESEQEEVKAIIRTKQQSPIDRPSGQSDMYVAPSERFKTNAIVFQVSQKSPLTMRDPDNLPHRIQIPKEEWKQGLVYKVKDCFYNDKGYFLYRVPGLIS